MNPMEQKTRELCEYVMDFKKMDPTPYNKAKTSPFTKLRIILMNGTEFEAQWFLHQFARHTDDSALKQDLALVRAQEQQQQKRVSCLKPPDETLLEETIAYEQLAVELTAILAQNEPNAASKKALDFALLEDFDHLYRFANLLKCDEGIDAGHLVGGYTEIMPGRPTVAEHRYPADNLTTPLRNKKAALFSKCAAGIITAAEQQTMNFYMNMAQMYPTLAGRRLYAEIALVEEEHVSQYESLQDPCTAWVESWVMHEYTEAYLYYSLAKDECDEAIAQIWQEHFEMECAHLKLAAHHLKRCEGKDFSTLFPQPDFPALLQFGSNKGYVREVLESVRLTCKNGEYPAAEALPADDSFFAHQKRMLSRVGDVPSHITIETAIKELGTDYRSQDAEHPILALRNREKDNTRIGRS